VGGRGARTLGLRDRPRARFDFVVWREEGGRVECACGHTGPVQVRRQIAPGSYYALVRARGHGGGAYRLSLLIREITSTTVAISPTETTRGRSVTLSGQVTRSPGPVKIEIDRFDPLQGWVFSKLYRVTAASSGGASLSWLPPSVGRWRTQATFLGTATASQSQSGYAHLHVS